MPLPELLDHAAGHHGLFTADEALACGVGRQSLNRLAERGGIELVGNRVYRVRGSVGTWHQRVLAGVLTTGAQALASHRTAAAMWGLPHAARRSVEVLAPRGVNGLHRWARRHETRHLTGADVDLRDGIPVTTIERTLVDLAAVVPLGPLARLLDDARELELTTWDRVDQRLDELPTRGRRGVTVLRVLLEERIGSPRDGTRTFENVLLRLIRRSGLPEPVRQLHVVHGDQHFYLDFAFPEHRVALECDGAGHASPHAHAYDLARQNAIIEQGWNLRRFTWSEVRLHPTRTVDTIRRALLAKPPN